MSSKGTTTTISMEALNKLYFQFFEKYVMPNLTKIVTQVQNLLLIKNTYEVYRYLEEATKETQAIEMTTPVSSNNNNHFPPKNHNFYQYALPTLIDNPKPHQFNQSTSQEKIEQNGGISFKNKPSVKKSISTNHYQQLPKPFELIKNKSQEQHSHRLMKPPSVNLDYQSDFKIQYNIKRTISYAPQISSSNRIQFKEEAALGKNLKQIVKKLGKVFNQNHSKIQKYNKNNQISKLMNLNVSTKLQRRDDLKNINSLK